jgi:hypothetical protein
MRLRATRLLWPALLAVLVLPLALPAQDIIDRARRQLDRINETTRQVRGLDCEVRGKCGTVRQSADFAPGRYSSLAVAVADASRRVRENHLGQVRDIFEGALIENDYLLAPDASMTRVRQMFQRDRESWSEKDLEQLAEFVTNIDAVLLVTIQDVSTDRCQIDDRYATEITVDISVRWLNTPEGDVPWTGTHSASTCTQRNSDSLGEALEKVSSQLASRLPNRRDR